MISLKNASFVLLIAIGFSLTSTNYLPNSMQPFLKNINKIGFILQKDYKPMMLTHHHGHHHHHDKDNSHHHKHDHHQNISVNICDDFPPDFPPPDTNTTSILCVDSKGCCNFTTVQSAVDASPVLSQKRIIIWINSGLY